jgi:23S rRNA (cytidine1920-2'-O)/16S rRNA (cytidine1409-2'-O)-methyltransferase
MRVDEALVARGLVASRSQARDLVLRGEVVVDGTPARKPSQTVTESVVLTLKGGGTQYVSRSAHKLVQALDHFNILVTGRICLDIGASTGGFTQVLLERGAAHVTAIDVGHGQMTAALAADPRVTLREGVNARDLGPDDLPDALSLVVCDVSFISLKLALAPVLKLATANTHLVALIKPQFEVGRSNLGRGGVVRNEALHETVCNDIADFLAQSGWQVAGLTPSPIAGGDGNQEFLVCAVKRPDLIPPVPGA